MEMDQWLISSEEHCTVCNSAACLLGWCFLVHSGFTPIILYKGKKVLETIQQEQPELVILDIMLPDITGFELCEQIRGLATSAAQTPIILLTAKGEAIDKLKGFNLGVDDYIVKPFDPNELIARMRAVLRR